MNKISQLDSLVHYTYNHLFDIDPGKLVITSDELESVNKGVVILDEVISKHVIQIKEKLPAKVMDNTTVDLIEIPELFKAINYTKTVTGAATLFRSLVQPLTSLDLIHAKQDSVKELKENTELTYKLNEYIGSVVEKERDIYEYFFGEHSKFSQYRIYHGTSVFFKRLMNGIKNIPESKTPYLETLLEDIGSIDGTHGIELIKGPVYSTFGGLKPRKEVGFFTPRIRFTLQRLKPSLLAPFVAAFLTSFFIRDPSLAILNLPLIAVMGFFTAQWLPEEFDYDHFTLPLRDVYVADKNIRKGVDAIGKIDELLSFHEYYEAMRSKCVEMTIPVVTDTSPHYFIAKGARNPILAKTYCVPDDISLNGQKTTFITGPNSGGKSTYIKTIPQIQIMAQIGNYVPAGDGTEMGIADRIFFQQQNPGKLGNREGRFGVESEETKDHFFLATPKSLVLLDAIISGSTNHEAAIKQLYRIMNGFYIKGGNTILITPDYDLVNKFEQEGRGGFLQVGVRRGKPTYKLVPGISTEGYTDLVLSRIGFSDEDIEEHLKKEGYLK